MVSGCEVTLIYSIGLLMSIGVVEAMGNERGRGETYYTFKQAEVYNVPKLIFIRI